MKYNRNIPDVHSRDIIGYLRSQGMTMLKIAKILKTGVPYVSLVASGDRNLTIEHMRRLARARKMPLWELILNSTPVDNIPSKHRDAYRELVKVLKLTSRPSDSADPDDERLVMAK
jgi:transcriptional regulator with XRE-family HTH domain